MLTLSGTKTHDPIDVKQGEDWASVLGLGVEADDSGEDDKERDGCGRGLGSRLIHFKFEPMVGSSALFSL